MDAFEGDLHGCAVDLAEVGEIAVIQQLADDCGLEKWTDQGYSQEILSEAGIVLVSRHPQGDLLGIIAGRIVPGAQESCPDAEILNVGVSKKFQRHGVGCSLLQAFLDLCSVRNVRTVWLEVRASNNSAIEFYETAQFVKTGVRRNFYRNPPEDALLMQLTLPRNSKNADKGLDDMC